MAQTLFDKMWDAHVVTDLGDGWALLHIDRHLLHDLSGAPALNELVKRGMTVRNPELAFATPDHVVASTPGRTGQTFSIGAPLWETLKQRSAEFGMRFFEVGLRGQGIVHVMGPELGIVLPGMIGVFGDSHTCTNGAVGTLAFGVWSSEIVHALATQTLRQKKPKNMRVRFEGKLKHGVAAKDLILHLIGKIGTAAATGYAVEYAGSAIREMDVEGRFTICNLTAEMGAKMGMIAPDEKTYAYIQGRPFAPTQPELSAAIAYWKTLVGDDDAAFDREEVIDVGEIAPTVTWGTSPEQTMRVDGLIPQPKDQTEDTRKSWEAALEYMGLVAGAAIVGTKIDWVFIGSCTNSRLSDLREAAKFVRGHRVAEGVHAWVVPGSEEVKRAAEAEGLDMVFKEAGFEWREAGCSLCVAANGDRIPAGARVISTSNRNFVGRQGPGARTHLASPAMAAAAAIAGAITDVRSLA